MNYKLVNPSLLPGALRDRRHLLFSDAVDGAKSWLKIWLTVGMWRRRVAPFKRYGPDIGTSRTTHVALIASIACLVPDDQYCLMVRAAKLKG